MDFHWFLRKVDTNLLRFEEAANFHFNIQRNEFSFARRNDFEILVEVKNLYWNWNECILILIWFQNQFLFSVFAFFICQFPKRIQKITPTHTDCKKSLKRPQNAFKCYQKILKTKFSFDHGQKDLFISSSFFSTQTSS